ncbi:MAG: hypothetical protein AB1714_29005 [Acidobacteriota bacterium]
MSKKRILTKRRSGVAKRQVRKPVRPVRAAAPRNRLKKAKPASPRPRSKASRAPESRPAARTRRSSPVIPAQPDPSVEAMALFDRGVEFFNARKFERAQKVFGAILDKCAEAREFHDRARLYLNLIEKQLNPAPSRPMSFEDYYNQAIYNLNLGDYDRALDFLKKASVKRPGDASITYFTALGYAGKSDSKAAHWYLKQAIELDPENRVLARNESEFQQLMDNAEFKELLFPRRVGTGDERRA